MQKYKPWYAQTDEEQIKGEYQILKDSMKFEESLLRDVTDEQKRPAIRESIDRYRLKLIEMEQKHSFLRQEPQFDPDETLIQLRTLAKAVLENIDPIEDVDIDEDAEGLAEKFIALDNWITGSKGLPDAWESPPHHGPTEPHFQYLRDGEWVSVKLISAMMDSGEWFVRFPSGRELHVQPAYMRIRMGQGAKLRYQYLVPEMAARFHWDKDEW
jgi:hypothetical protein